MVNKEGEIAVDFFTYVDNQRFTGDTQLKYWSVLQIVTGYMSYFGLQFSTRKSRKVGDDMVA